MVINDNISNIESEEMNTLITEWYLIYKGKQSWLKYKYGAIDGRVHKRKKKFINAAKLVVSELSGLIWAEQPFINTDEQILGIMNNSKFFDKMPEFTERLLALGGGVLKIYTEDGLIKIDYVPADRFVPISWNTEGIYEADFIDKRVIKDKTYIRVESHRKIDGGYQITNKVYENTNGAQNEVSLSIIDPNLQSSTIIAVNKPLFSYVRVPGDNNLVDDSPLGVSIYGNAVDTLHIIDMIFDALNQEVLLGKKRIIVPASALRTIMNAETGKPERFFDPSDEVYQALNVDDNEKLQINDNSVELRVEELKMALNTAFSILSVQIGFSAGYLNIDSNVSGILKTATEVISENSKTFKTKQLIENSIADGIQNLMESIRELALLYNFNLDNEPYTIMWEDNIIEDRNTKTDYWLKRLQSNTCTLEEFLIKVDGISEEEAIAKAALIENKTNVDVNSLFGGTDVIPS